MGFETIQAIENDAERTNRTYEIFDEDTRLVSRASRVEFLTTVRYIEKYLKPELLGMSNHLLYVGRRDDS